MLNQDLIKSKIDLITKDLERLKSFGNKNFDEIANNFIEFSALQNLLMKIIGRAIDINEHIIAKKSDLDKSFKLKYRETFLQLGEMKIFPIDFAQEIAKSAGLRNALVHEYDNLDNFMIYQTVNDAIIQYTKYCDFILKYLEKA